MDIKVSAQKKATAVFLLINISTILIILGWLLTGEWELEGAFFAIIGFFLIAVVFGGSLAGYLVFLKSFSVKQSVLRGVLIAAVLAVVVIVFFSVVGLSAQPISRQLDQQVSQDKANRNLMSVANVRETHDSSSITVEIGLAVKKNGQYRFEVDWQSNNYPVEVSLADAWFDEVAVDLSQSHQITEGAHILTLKWQLELEGVVTNTFWPMDIALNYFLGDTYTTVNDEQGSPFHYETREYNSGFYFIR